MSHNQLKDLVRNEGESVEGTTVKDIGREVSIIVDKGNVGDLTHTKSRKRRRSDKEIADTWTRKMSKVSFQMRMLPSLTVNRRKQGRCVKLTRLLPSHQLS